MATFPPAFDGPAEDEDSPFYGLPVPTPVIPALSFDDGKNGRYCTKTQIFVPQHRLAWFEGKPYLDKVCPTKGEIAPDPPQGIQ